jgi:hypothetical protein
MAPVSSIEFLTGHGTWTAIVADMNECEPRIGYLVPPLGLAFVPSELEQKPRESALESPESRQRSEYRPAPCDVRSMQALVTAGSIF